jgi:hypothetical protein
MATFPKLGLALRRENNPLLSYATRELHEGATQTFVAHAPVVLSSGLIVEGANPVTAIFGVALGEGQNAAAGTKRTKVLPAMPGLTVFGNLLDDAAANLAFAAAHVGATFRLVKTASFIAGARTGWHFQNTASSHAVKVVSRETDHFLPNTVENKFVAVGDINARVEAIFLDSVRSWL